MMRESSFGGVFEDGDKIYTVNSTPGRKVYGEKLIDCGGVEYREWVSNRSKLAAYFMKGGSFFPFHDDSKVLYLGAASGTTSSHIADIVVKGTVSCVEFSPRSFRDLVSVCESRTNMIPILADATRPEEYSFVVSSPDIVYQDIAQKGQAAIFIKNFKAFSAKSGMLVIKSRSEDVSKDPRKIYAAACDELTAAGLKVVELQTLDPFEKDHAMIGVDLL